LLSELFRTLRHGEEEQQEQQEHQEHQEHQLEEGRGRIILSFQITRNSSSHAEITRISLKSFQITRTTMG
jgi:hypothetical protein